MGDDLMSRYNIWNDQDYEDFLSADYIGIFLNLHKDCSNRQRWRTPSPGAIPSFFLRCFIIGERCYGKDELEFKGLIDFVDH